MVASCPFIVEQTVLAIQPQDPLLPRLSALLAQTGVLPLPRGILLGTPPIGSGQMVGGFYRDCSHGGGHALHFNELQYHSAQNR